VKSNAPLCKEKPVCFLMVLNHSVHDALTLTLWPRHLSTLLE